MSTAPPTALQFDAGDILNHSLQLQRHVATGGFAEIWKARQVRTGDTVAVKILVAKGQGRPNMELRMTREVEILNLLRHPNAIQYKGHDRVFARTNSKGLNLSCPVGCPFLVLEWVDGQSLGSLMRRRKRQGALSEGILTLEEASRWFAQVIDALDEAHRIGVLHRDITPGNLFIRRDGRALLLDWNLGVARESSDITVLNNPAGAGTAYYAAPEQVDSLASANETADVYSLAVVMIKALTGESLRELSEGGSSRLLNTERVRQALQVRGKGAMPSVPEGLATLLVSALNSNPAARPQSVRAFLPALEHAAAEDRTCVLRRRALRVYRNPSVPAPPLPISPLGLQQGEQLPEPPTNRSDSVQRTSPFGSPEPDAAQRAVAASRSLNPGGRKPEALRPVRAIRKATTPPGAASAQLMVPPALPKSVQLRAGLLVALKWVGRTTKREPLTGMFAAAVLGSGLTLLLAQAFG